MGSGYRQGDQGAWGGPGDTPPEAVQCACGVDLRYPGLIKAFDVRGWTRAAVQAVFESGDWDGSSGGGADNGTIQIFRSVNGKDYDASAAIGSCACNARVCGDLDPKGCAFLVAVITPGSKQTSEAIVSLYCSGDSAQVLVASAAPTDASYLTLGLASGLSAERVLTAGIGVTFTDSGANGTLTIDAGTGVYAPIGGPYVTIGNTGTLSAERALTGTSNQVVITDNGANSTVVLSLPQSIDTGASVTFLNVTLGNGGALRTSTSAGNTLLIQARDVDGAAYTTFITLTANNTPTCDLDGAVTIASAYIYRVSGTDVAVTDGGTGVSTLTTAYGTLCAGTTATGAVQTVSPGTAGQVLTSNGAAALPSYQARKRSFGFSIKGQPAVGLVGYVTVPEACTIVKNRLTSNIAISAVVEIKKVAYASFPGSLTSIVASAAPTLSAATKSEDSTLTGWTTALAAGDILEFSLTSVGAGSNLAFELEVTVP